MRLAKNFVFYKISPQLLPSVLLILLIPLIDMINPMQYEMGQYQRYRLLKYLSYLYYEAEKCLFMSDKISEDKNVIVLCFFLMIVFLGLLLRLKNIASPPFNFDEGVHGFFSYLLYAEGVYTYKPGLHGPFLYYITACAFSLLGDTILTARLMPAIFGAGTMLLLYPLRKHFGDIGLLTTSILFAISPFFITFSQELRNDPFSIFFTLGFIVCALLYLERKKDIYLALGVTNLALAFTVKENAYITVSILLLYLIFYYGYAILKSHNKIEVTKKILSQLLQNAKKNHLTIFTCVLIFIVIYTLFYTHFFMSVDSFFTSLFESIPFWFRATFLYSMNPGVYRPFCFYLNLLIKFELPVLIFGTTGGLYYLTIERNKVMQFMFCWAVISLVTYSAMPYKMHQLLLFTLLPLIIVAGGFMGKLFGFLSNIRRTASKKGRILRILLIVLFIVLIGYSYSHSVSDIAQLHNVTGLYTGLNFEELSQYVKDATGGNLETIVFIIIPQGEDMLAAHWPLPWYLREYATIPLTGGLPPNLDKLVEAYENPIFISSKNDIKYLNASYEIKVFNSTGSMGLVVFRSAQI